MYIIIIIIIIISVYICPSVGPFIPMSRTQCRGKQTVRTGKLHKSLNAYILVHINFCRSTLC